MNIFIRLVWLYFNEVLSFQQVVEDDADSGLWIAKM